MSSNFPKALYGRERGAALIVALVVVLLVVMLATRVSSDYLVLFRSVENQSGLQQARAYLRGAELVATEALLRDMQSSSEIDSMLEPWAQRANLPLPEGVLDACVTDLQARLNLNDLLSVEGSYSPAQKRFIRLLQVVDPELDSAAATALANAVFDWIDPDSNQRYPGGAEALDYMRANAPHPYRPANQAFASVSELRLIAGFDSELVAALTPHLSVWGNGNMNLNTMDAESGATIADQSATDSDAPVLLRTLNTADSLLPLSSDGARLLAAARSNNGGVFENFEVFTTAPFTAQQWELDGLALTSSFFELRAVMQSSSRTYAMTSVLQRDIAPTGEPRVNIVSRRFNGAETGGTGCAAALP